MMIYSREPDGFSDVDEKMLAELAGEFANGLVLLRLRAAKVAAEESLHAREARLRLALDAGRLATWDWDIASGHVVWNEAHFRMLGYAPDSLVPSYQGWADRVHPDDRPATEQAIRQAMEQGRDYGAEFRVCWPDGTVHWLEARGRFERDAEGRAVRNYGVMQDVTERRLAERLSQALNAIHAAIHATPHVEQIMQYVITEATRALGCDTAAVSLRRANEWVVSYAHGFPVDVLGRKMSDEDEPHALLAIKLQAPLAIDDAYADPRVNRDRMRKWGVRSVLVVPLLIRQEAAGVLFFNFRNAPQAFGPAHLDFAVKLAAAVALALDNARLFADIKSELSERKKAEEARRESEERLRFALDSCRIGAWDLDLVDHTAFRSSEHDRIFGYAEPLPQWTYEQFLGHVLPEDRADVDTKFSQANATGGIWDFECRIRRQDGELRWIWAAGRHHIDPAGHGRLAGIVQDITERKRAEEEARRLHATIAQEKDRLAALVNSIADEIWFADVAGQFTLMNPSASREFKLESGAEIDIREFARTLEVLRPDGTPRPVEEAPSLRALHGELVRNQEEIIRIPAVGELRYRQVSAAPVRDICGSILGSVAVVRDITERKRAEAELQERDERIQQALRVSRSFAFEWEPATDRVTRSKDCGPILRLEGAAVESDTGAHYFQRVHAEDRERFVGLLQALTPAAPTYRTQYRILCPDGETVTLEEAGRAYFDADGRLERLAGISTDVTAREQAAAALRESRNQLSRAQEIAHLGSWELDLARNELTWLDETYRIFGLAPQEFAATYQAFLEHIHPEDRAAVDAAYAGSVRAGQEAYEIEHRIVRATTGEVRWVRRNAATCRTRRAGSSAPRAWCWTSPSASRPRTGCAKRRRSWKFACRSARRNSGRL